jgi:hypothetical protein
MLIVDPQVKHFFSLLVHNEGFKKNQLVRLMTTYGFLRISVVAPIIIKDIARAEAIKKAMQDYICSDLIDEIFLNCGELKCRDIHAAWSLMLIMAYEETKYFKRLRFGIEYKVYNVTNACPFGKCDACSFPCDDLLIFKKHGSMGVEYI